MAHKSTNKELRRFLEGFIPGAGRAKHPGKNLLVDSRADLPDASPLQE